MFLQFFFKNDFWFLVDDSEKFDLFYVKFKSADDKFAVKPSIRAFSENHVTTYSRGSLVGKQTVPQKDVKKCLKWNHVNVFQVFKINNFEE